MLYELSDKTIIAIRNALVIIGEAPAELTTADQLIRSQSVDELNEIVAAWDHEQKLWDE